MKTLALLGGMTHSATSIYYNIINTQIQRRLGGTNSASLLLHSFNHAKIGALFTSNAWPLVTQEFVTAALNLKAAGAQGLMILCNIGHAVADEVERQSGLPLLHIADYTGQIIKEKDVGKVALIGTKPVMEMGFFRERLREKFGVEVVVPSEEKRERIQEMIFRELGASVFHDGQKKLLLDAIEETKGSGAEGVVFACTELQFVLGQKDVDLPLWDTMGAHAMGAVEWMLEDEEVKGS